VWIPGERGRSYAASKRYARSRQSRSNLAKPGGTVRIEHDSARGYHSCNICYNICRIPGAPFPYDMNPIKPESPFESPLERFKRSM